jgi:O-antigen ligase
MRLTIDAENVSVVGLASSLPFGLLAATFNTFLSKSKWRTVLSAACLAIIGYASLVSATRGVFVAYGAGLVVALLLLVRHVKLRRYGVIGVGAILSIAGVGIFMPAEQLQRSLDRLLGNFSDSHIVVDPSSAERLYAWSTAEWLMRHYPWIGAGFGSFSYYSFAPYPHNMFMEIGAAGGLAGLLLIVLWLLLVVKDLFTVRRILGGYGIFLMAMWVAAFTHMQLSFAFFMAKPLFLMSALASAFAANSVKTARSMKRNSPNRLRIPPREALT